MRSTVASWNVFLAKMGWRRKRGNRAYIGRQLRFEPMEDRQMLAILTVNSIADTHINTNGLLTFREAIEVVGQGSTTGLDSTTIANQISGTLGVNDKIIFDSALDGEEILLSRTIGQLNISTSLTIDASALDSSITVKAQDSTGGFHNNGDGIRIFNITDASSGASPPIVEMIGLALTGADPSPGFEVPEGGAIRSAGILTLRDMSIHDNGAGLGAGIFLAVAGNGSTPRTILTIVNSRIEDNSAYLDGGGVYVQFSSTSDGQDTVLINGSTLTHNVAGPAAFSGRGGGLFITGGGTDSHHVVTTSTAHFDENTADIGGGIYHESNSNSGVDLSILELSSISGNTALEGFGGGLYSRARGASAVRVADSIISGNTSATSGGGLWGKLFEEASLVVERSTVSENTAEGAGDGGGIFAFADSQNSNPLPITISRSLVSGNTANNRGGGVYTRNFDGMETRIQDSRITDNHVPFNTHSGHLNGGGIYAYIWDNSGGTDKPRFTITGSTVDNNDTFQNGGGIFVCAKYNGEFAASNTTISGNRTVKETIDPENPQLTARGGGIFIARFNSEMTESIDAFLRNVTVTQNVSASGGGVETLNIAGARTQIDNSIISENFDHSSAYSNLVGRVDTDNTKYNLIGSGSTILDLSGAPHSLDSITNILNNDTPLLGPLQDNGGPTWTHALLAGSAAIDAGSFNFAKDPFTGIAFATDQRGPGFPRIFNVTSVGDGAEGPVDIGAYEIGLPKVIDVRLLGVQPGGATPTAWANAISFATLVPLGKQLAPVYRYGTTKIQIAFSEAVTTSAAAFTLFGSDVKNSGHVKNIPQVDTFNYNTDTNVATLTYATTTPLSADRYRIDVDATGVTGVAGHLDGKWDDINQMTGVRYDNGTLYDWTDDHSRSFPSGNGMGGTSFQFRFALAPGDYNQNGVIEAGDYAVWRDAQAHVDGDGDGLSDQSGDYDVWASQYGLYLWFQKFQGDYNTDGIVDSRDYVTWKMNFGATSGIGLEADGSDNGVVDAADYALWGYWNNTLGAWYISPSGIAAGTALVDSISAPEVVNVTISGSTSTHPAYSFDAHDGSGEQLLTVPVGGADTISITFSENVNVDASNLRVVGLSTANVPTVVDFVYDAATMTATWRFDDLVANDHYVIALSDAVTDTEGNRLDGEWVNPVSVSTTNSLVSEFPSGDGHAGGNFNFVMTLLGGDVNLDANLNGLDIGIFLSNYGLTSGCLFTQGDSTGDGAVNGLDVARLLLNFGTNLTATTVLADLNGDFKVDDTDVETLADNFGMSSPTHADGDLNGDGYIDATDLDLMFAQYGLELAVVS